MSGDFRFRRRVPVEVERIAHGKTGHVAKRFAVQKAGFPVHDAHHLAVVDQQVAEPVVAVYCRSRGRLGSQPVGCSRHSSPELRLLTEASLDRMDGLVEHRHWFAWAGGAPLQAFEPVTGHPVVRPHRSPTGGVVPRVVRNSHGPARQRARHQAGEPSRGGVPHGPGDGSGQSAQPALVERPQQFSLGPDHRGRGRGRCHLDCERGPEVVDDHQGQLGVGITGSSQQRVPCPRAGQQLGQRNAGRLMLRGSGRSVPVE